MIVYPAYAYMGKAPSVPDFPFWENGELKVSTEGSFRFVFYPNENHAQVSSGRADFTVDASKYSKIRFNANAYTTISLLVFAVENGKTFGNRRYFVEASKKDFDFTIPEEFRKNNATFEFNPGDGTLFLNSVVLTN